MKVEHEAAAMHVFGAKSYYFLQENEADDGDLPASVIRWKGAATAKSIPKSQLKAMAERKCLVRERTTKINGTNFSVCLEVPG
jgi:hypothetical protein